MSIADLSLKGQAVDPESQRGRSPRIEGQRHGASRRREIAIELPAVIASQRNLKQTPALARLVVVEFAHQVSSGLWFDVVALVAVTMHDDERTALPTGDIGIDRLQPEDQFRLPFQRSESTSTQASQTRLAVFFLRTDL